MNIYELTNDMLKIMELMETSDIDEEVLTDTFDAIDSTYSEKINSYCKMINYYKYAIEALKAEKIRISERIKSCEKAEIRLKATITESLFAIDKRNYKTELYTINRLTRTKLVETGKIPEDYKKIVERKETDTAAIKLALDRGEKLPFAKYVSSCTVR